MSTPFSPSPSPFAQTSAGSAPVETPPAPGFGTPDDETFAFDLTNAQSSGLIAEGTYLLHLIDLTQETSSKGNPMWVFKFEILRKSDGTETSQKGRSISKKCAITESALGILASTVEALGLGRSGQADMNFKKSQALGRLCYGDVAAGSYVDNSGNERKSSNLNNLYPFDPIGAKWDRATGRPVI
jgi:hypothetical protein